MTSGFFSRRLALMAAVSTSLWLASCGGSDNDSAGSTNLRAINLTIDLASVDLYTSDTKRFSALATDALASNISLESNTYTVNVKRAGDGATLFTGAYGLAKDQHYTAIVWGRETALRVSTLPEDENNADIASGNSRIRMFSATIDSGTLDVFFTSPNAELADTTPTQGNLPAGNLSGFRDVSAGTYRLRVTGAGDPSDVRLDIPVVTLTDRQHATLVLTATGSGGVLLNGTLLLQQSTKTSMKNTKARVRMVASVASAGIVSADIGGTTVFSAYRSPRVSTRYALVDSGSLTTAISVNGSTVNSSTRSFVAGTDYTLMAYGSTVAPQVALFVDDNRIPSTAARAKIRLVNGVATSDPLTLSLDFQNFDATSDVAAGVASAYASPSVAGSTRIEINSQLVAEPIFTVSTTSSTQTLLLGQGVYTVFILDGQTTPAGRFIKDR